MQQHPIITQEDVDRVVYRARRMRAETLARQARGMGRALGRLFHPRG